MQLYWGPDLRAGQTIPVEDDQKTIRYLKSLSIEELLQTQITSVSKKSEQLFTAAAAVTVITQEDLRRAGILTIPEALRLVPGLQVAQIDGSRWAIGARGFNEYFANKLLVLIDGRSVYTPLFSGVYWNAQDTIIEDIERIEVIRGPGATIWGANAVNGVINIITKHSADTQGGYISTVIGSHEQPLVSTRYGGKIDPKTTYRLFAKGFDRENLDRVGSGDAFDSWKSLRAGFRLDREHTDSDSISLQANTYKGEADATFSLTGFLTPPYSRIETGTEDYDGINFLLNWQHRASKRSTTDIQLYYDGTSRDQVVGEEQRHTVDFEIQHHLDPAGIHDIVWGAGFRWTKDDITGTYTVNFDPDSRSDQLFSTFLQDDITLIADTAWLTVGSKFEHNDYSGFEIQPSIRFRLQTDPKHLFWSAVSRAVRTPSRSDHDVVANPYTMVDSSGNLINSRLLGNKDFDSEKLISYELGYRWQASDTLSLDLATYYNDYQDIRFTKIGSPFVDLTSGRPLLVFPQYMYNSIEGETYGLELQTTWQATDNLKIFAGYTWLQLDLEYSDPSRIGHKINEESLSPEHQIQLRSYLDLPGNLALDCELYYVSQLKDSEIDPYLRFDMQLSWQPHQSFTGSIGVDNLFESSHPEFENRTNIIASEIPRKIWVKATYTF